MELIDANIVLRFLLKDHAVLSARAADLLRDRQVVLLPEVLCEVVFVLEKVYGVGRAEIHRHVSAFLRAGSVLTPDQAVALRALQEYRDSKLDIVDSLLLAYHAVHRHAVHTFDKGLDRCLKRASA